MLQREPNGLDWRYDPPFAAASTSRPFDSHTPVKSPPKAHRPAPKPSLKPIPARDNLSPSPRPVPSTSTSRTPSLSLQIPPSDHTGRHPSQSLPIRPDKEKGNLKSLRSPRSSRRGTPDPEKASHDHPSMRSLPSSVPVSHHSTVIYEEEDEDEHDDPKNHAVWILVSISHTG